MEERWLIVHTPDWMLRDGSAPGVWACATREEARKLRKRLLRRLGAERHELHLYRLPESDVPVKARRWRKRR